MKKYNIDFRLRLVGITLIALLLQFSASVHALNRNDVFSELENINTSWNEISLSLWVNDFENDPDPGVTVDDRLIYRVKTSQSAYFVLILVDSKGGMAVLRPDAQPVGDGSEASNSLVFSIEGSDSGQIIFKQAGPLGKDTVYLLASKEYMPSSVFEFDGAADYVDYGTDITKIRDLVSRLNEYSETGKITSVRYEYRVDADTQFTSRGISVAITDRKEEVEVTIAKVEASGEAIPIKSTPVVINDIKFEYDSDVLTSTGVNQLEILGSELVDRQLQSDLPKILLTGHTDSIGSSAYNMELSKKRSMASKRFLIEEFGLPANDIETHGLGESAPINGNETDKGRARNRRVEFEIVQ